jgi:hypothetical protein
MCMILGWLVEVKLGWKLERWFSTSRNGGFRPGRSCRAAAIGGGLSLPDQCAQCLSFISYQRFIRDHPRSSAVKGFCLSPSLRGEIYFAADWARGFAAADRRSPHSTSKDDPTIASPTDIKSAVITDSCQGNAL